MPQIAKVRSLLGLILLLGACARNEAAAQQQPMTISVVSTETYRRVVDLVFPRDPGNFRDQAKEFALTLRFAPSFAAESQINITKYSDGRLEVVAYTLPKGSPNIGEQLNAILQQTGQENVEEMAKRIKVQRQTLSNTKEVRRLLRRFSALRLSPQLDTYAFLLDPALFQLWYEAVSNESYYSLAVPRSEQDRGDHPLVRWMNEVRQAVLKLR